MAHTEVQLQMISAIPLAVVQRVVPASALSKAVPEGCGTVWSFLRSHGLRGGRNVALYWDAAIRLEVGVEFDGAIPSGGEVVRSATPAGEVVSVTHFGPYGQLGSAHRAITEWCAAHGRTPAGPSWEIYGHWEEAWNSDASRIRTDICYLL